MDYLDELFEENDHVEEEAIEPQQPVAHEPTEEEILQRSCSHTELYNSICLKCNKSLTRTEIHGSGAQV